ncbi:MAG TPA: 30S ribosome-binding factor RbfA [Blastocatellia bacterium]|nr:30S ribosome-binding factor RbfA [Blastocatellia bacterium]
MPGRRPERVAEQIREEVSQIILGDMRDPRVEVVTVTYVKVTPDLRHAKVYVTSIGTEDEMRESLAALNSAAGFIRRELGSALKLRHTPELHFVYDQTADSAARIEQILKEESDRLREQEGDIKDSPTIADAEHFA